MPKAAYRITTKLPNNLELPPLEIEIEITDQGVIPQHEMDSLMVAVGCELENDETYAFGPGVKVTIERTV